MVHYVYENLPGVPAEEVVDVYQMSGSCISEHWSVNEKLPEGSDVPRSANATIADIL